MKRKKEESVPEKKERVELSERTLRNIFRLIRKGCCEEAKALIPPESRHLPLSFTRVDLWRSESRKNKVRHVTWPLLVHAAHYRRYAILEYLLDGGANIEQTESQVSDTLEYICTHNLFVLVWSYCAFLRSNS